MMMTPRLLLAGPIVLAALACGHSEPFATADQTIEGTLSTLAPIRLTFSPGANLYPSYSVTGGEIVYSYQRGTPDRDRCLGVLPGGGGTRIRSLCWEELGQDSTADGLEVGALAADGRLAFTRHSGQRVSAVPNTGGLYITRTGNVRDAEKVLDLLVFQPAAGTNWDYLLDLQWTGPNELTALATDLVMISTCPPATCWDTTHVALHLATINVAQRPATVTAQSVPVGTTGIAVDVSTGRRYARTGARVVELLANGGDSTVYQIPARAFQSDARVTGLTAAAGRVIVADRYTLTPPPPAVIVQGSDMRLLDGGLNPIVASLLQYNQEFRGATLDPSGRRVIYGARQGAARHLYLVELP